MEVVKNVEVMMGIMLEAVVMISKMEERHMEEVVRMLEGVEKKEVILVEAVEKIMGVGEIKLVMVVIMPEVWEMNMLEEAVAKILVEVVLKMLEEAVMVV